MVIMVGDLKDDNILVQQEYFLHLKIVHNIQNTGAVIVKNNGLRFFCTITTNVVFERTVNLYNQRALSQTSL